MIKPIDSNFLLPPKDTLWYEKHHKILLLGVCNDNMMVGHTRAGLNELWLISGQVRNHLPFTVMSWSRRNRRSSSEAVHLVEEIEQEVDRANGLLGRGSWPALQRGNRQWPTGHHYLFFLTKKKKNRLLCRWIWLASLLNPSCHTATDNLCY